MPIAKPLRPHPLFLAAIFLLSAVFSLQAQELGAVLNKSGNSTTSVTFRVWAPNARAVAVAGEFNGWNATAHPLKSETINGTAFWTGNVSTARAGQAYKYAITTSSNATLWKKDPRGRQVRTLRGAPGYVTANSSEQASVIYDKDAFDWSGDTFKPPAPADVVMYELHVGTFYDPTPNDGRPATFDDAILKLDYLKELGVNMIALMPVGEFNGMHSWGYNPTDLFAIEESYGGPDAFKRFVKTAHSMNMSVQVDVVHNHYGEIIGNTGSNTTMAWESAKKCDLEGFDGGEPYFYSAADETSPELRGISKTKWGPRPKYSEPRVQEFITDNIKMYLDEYKVWALRWDSPRNITGFFKLGNGTVNSTSIGDPNTPIPQAVAMMTKIHEEIANPRRSNFASYYSIAEDADSPGGYTGHWEISYHDAIFSWLVRTGPNGTLSPPFNTKYPTGNFTMGNIEHRIENREPFGFRVVFLENHDKCGDHNSATDGKRMAEDFDPADPASVAAKKKTLAAATATLTAAGTPMLWMGQEQLANGDFNDKRPLDWNRAAQFPGIVRFHRDLINLRKTLPALTTAGNYTSANLSQLPFADVISTNQTTGLLVYRRDADANPSNGNEVLVAMNLSNSTQAVPASNFAGNWTVRLNSDSHSYDDKFGNVGPAAGTRVGNLSANVTIGSWGTLVLTRNSSFVPPVQDSNNNGLDDGLDLLFCGRAALPGSFNNWDNDTRVMRWDPSRRAYYFVSRFLSPGTNLFKAYTSDWAPGGDASFVVDEPSTWEVTYAPGNQTYSARKLGNGTATLPEEWKNFWFSTGNVTAGGDADADGWTNLQEFQRASDPTRFEQTRFGLVGGKWGWSPEAWARTANAGSTVQMRYAGHGIWKFYDWFPAGNTTDSRKFRIAQGPTNGDPNWGAGENATKDGARVVNPVADFSWPDIPAAWQEFAFNERNSRYEFPTLPRAALDSDADSMPDAWELGFGLNPFSAIDANGDWDSEEVLNKWEFARGSRPNDPSDHFAELGLFGVNLPFSMESGWITGRREPRIQMRWNRPMGEWEILRYSPRPQTLDMRVGAWLANGTVDWGPTTGNVQLTFPKEGYHIVRFEEFRKTYRVDPMPEADGPDADSIPDYWQAYFGNATSNANGDPDGDGVLNLAEFARASDPTTPDKSAEMNLVRNLTPDYFASKVGMAWDAASNVWWAVAWSPAGNNTAKFVAGSSWSEPNWGDNNPADGWADSNGMDIPYGSATQSRYTVFEFDEVWGQYLVRPLNPADGNNDGIADEWAQFHGTASAAADTDGDGWSSVAEFMRGMNPKVSDGRPKRMTVTGNQAPLPNWNPSVNNMVWSDQRGRWEWSGNFSSNATVEFKFSQANATDWKGGTSWGNGTMQGVAQADGGTNIPANVAAGRTLIHFDDTTGRYAVMPYPKSLGWLESRGISTAEPGDPWRRDTDNDGGNNLIEYAMGGSPASRDAPSRFNAEVKAAPTQGNFLVDFILRTDDPKLRHTILSSSNLAGAWTSNATGSNTPIARFVSSNSTGAPVGFTRFTYEATPAPEPRFFRIQSEILP